jgi:hypothetical protein
VTVFETLLRSLGDAQELPPSRDLRGRLREARNLLAEHRDERVLYWRLTGLHTPHVTERYTSPGLIATGSIDSEIVGLSPFGVDDETEIAAGLASVGTVGGLLSLPELRIALVQLEVHLAELAERFRRR